MGIPINMDDEIDWAKVDVNNPHLDEILIRLQESREVFYAILKKFDDLESELSYEEQEKYRMEIAEALEENAVWIDLLDKAIAIRNLTKQG
jgi:hypothetical protein